MCYISPVCLVTGKSNLANYENELFPPAHKSADIAGL